MAIPKNIPTGSPRPNGNQRPNQQEPQRRPNQASSEGRPVRPRTEGQNQARPVNRTPEQGTRRPARPVESDVPKVSRNSGRETAVSYDLDDELPSLESTDRPSSRPTRKNAQPVVNDYDLEEDDPFTSIPVDEQVDLEDEEELEEIRSNRRTRKPAPVVEEEVYEDEDDDNDYDDVEEEPVEAPVTPKKGRRKPEKKRKDKKGQDVFIDEENGVLKPFGGRKLKEHEFDRRKNMRKNAVIVQGVVIALLVILVGLGVKNTIFPPDAMTEQQVSEIVAVTSGLTSFPVEEGKGFASNFMQAYLTANADEVSSQILGYYYTGSMKSVESNSINRNVSNTYKQTILYGPTVYEAQAFNAYSARYTVGALIKPSSVNSETPVEGAEARWEFFNVNVYYNSVSDTFTITDDSPSVIPAVEIGEVSKLPTKAPLGTGRSDQELAASIQSVVHGFLQGYAVSTPADHATIDQYIIDSENPNLIRGLGGLYEFAGSVTDSVQFVAYPAVEGSTDEVKALTTVRWANKLGGSDSTMRIEYTSTYVMTLEKVGGKYVVSKFQPQYYESEKAEEIITNANNEG